MKKYSDGAVVTLAMGAGAGDRELLDSVIRPAIANVILAQGHDGARLNLAGPGAGPWPLPPTPT